MKDEREHPPYRIPVKGGSAEITEKKSRFIATLGSAHEEKEAAAFIELVRKRYWDAGHHCFAFVIGEQGGLTRCSDDKEPSGTAGKPMLKLLLERELRDAVLVVTRYFGGTLLGTGGLLRAYTEAAQAGLAASETALMVYGAELCVTADYPMAEKIRHLLRHFPLSPEKITYADTVQIILRVKKEDEERLCTALTQLTAGRVEICKISEKYFIDK